MRDFSKIIQRRKWEDRIFKILGIFCLVFCLGTLAALVLDLAVAGLKRIDWQFLSTFPSRRPERAGILSAIVGTLAVMFTTFVIAVPVGVAAGIYLEEYGSKKSWWRDFIELNIANLAGVPSIVYGLMALGLFVYQFKLGQSVIAAGLTLAILVLPIIIVATREALRAVPENMREAAAAMGATKWQVVRDHLLPYSSGGIATGVIIALSRAIGETAPLVTIGALTFIAFLPAAPFTGDFPFISFQWLSSPFTVLPIQMFNWVSRPDPRFAVNAAAAGLVLIVMTLGMNAFAIWLRYRVRKKIKW